MARSEINSGAAHLDALPPVFTYAQARRAGLDRHMLYRLRDNGAIEPLGRGVFRNANTALADETLAQVAARVPLATICLTSALVHHDLSDAIPLAPHVALPRGTRPPSISGNVTWHTFDPTTFDLGREPFAVDERLVFGVYNPERTIVDTFRLRHVQGDDEAYEALRRWLRKPYAQPAELLTTASAFPRSVGPIRHALEVLL